jgi:hypothetical protein
MNHLVTAAVAESYMAHSGAAQHPMKMGERERPNRKRKYCDNRTAMAARFLFGLVRGPTFSEK